MARDLKALCRRAAVSRQLVHITRLPIGKVVCGGWIYFANTSDEQKAEGLMSRSSDSHLSSITNPLEGK